MRTFLLFPLALAAAAIAGCGGDSAGTEQTAFRVPDRDLTLRQADEPAVDIASAVELRRSPPVQRPAAPRPRRVRRPAPVAPSTAAEPQPVAATPAPGLTQVEPGVVVASAAFEEPDPHALAPGQTVTIIPASGGGSSEPDWTDQLPGDADRGVVMNPGGRGGGCKPRGGGTLPGGIRGGGFRGLR